jgi:hypothetical protein
MRGEAICIQLAYQLQTLAPQHSGDHSVTQFHTQYERENRKEAL